MPLHDGPQNCVDGSHVAGRRHAAVISTAGQGTRCADLDAPHAGPVLRTPQCAFSVFLHACNPRIERRGDHENPEGP